MEERDGRWRPVVDEIEPRAFGIPTRWIRPPAGLDLRFLRHPGHFVRWRLERRRLGPYARSYAEIAARRAPADAASPDEAAH